MEYTKELLDACDVVIEIKASNGKQWYTLGYVAAMQTSERRNISRRSEVGSNATMLMVDEAQKSMSMQRLNVARIRGSAPYNKNLPAMIQWIVTDGAVDHKIVIDTDDPSFNKPFDLRKTYYTVVREDVGTGVAVAQTLYERCKVAQLTLGVGAASKYLDDGLAISWEKTSNPDLKGAAL